MKAELTCIVAYPTSHCVLQNNSSFKLLMAACWPCLLGNGHIFKQLEVDFQELIDYWISAVSAAV